MQMQPLFPELVKNTIELQADITAIPEIIDALLAMGPQEIYCFRGDLGAGKTTLTKGFLKAAGVEESVSSPTFSLVTPFALPEGSFFLKNAPKSPKLYHHDWYRIQEAGELFDAGIEEILNEYPSIHIVEWPEIGGFFIKDLIENFQIRCVEIQIQHLENQRLYKIISYNA